MESPKLNALEDIQELQVNGKFEDALMRILNLETKGGKEPVILMEYKIIKARILLYLDQENKAFEIADEVYWMSRKIGSYINSFDALMIKFQIYFIVENIEKIRETAEEAEKIFELLTDIPSEELIKRDADLWLFKAVVDGFDGEMKRALNYCMKAKKQYDKINDKLNAAFALDMCGRLSQSLGEMKKGLTFNNEFLALAESMGNKRLIASGLYFLSNTYRLMGEVDQSIDYAMQCLTYKEISDRIKIETLMRVGEIYRVKGDTDKALRYSQQSLDFSTELDNKDQISNSLWRIGAIYWTRGELDKAEDFLEKSLKLSEEHQFFTHILNSAFHLVRVYVDKGLRTKAEKCIQRMGKNLMNEKGNWARQLHHVAKAYMLKKSPKIRDRVEAEILLKQIVDDKILYHELTIFAIIELCDLLLMDVRETNNHEIFEDIKPLISKLLQISETQNSYRYMAEINLLQGKLALIQLDIDEARRFLTQAQQIADKHGLKQLAQKISHEHDVLLEQIDTWERLKEINTPVSERIELASLDGTIRQLEEKEDKDFHPMETEQPILIAVMSKTGFLVFTKYFSDDKKIQNLKIGDFLSSFNRFSDRFFSGSFDRAKFGEYTVLLSWMDFFSICYLFKGQSYSAGNKLNNFTQAIKENRNVAHSIERAVRIKQKMNPKDNPELLELVSMSFQSELQKFKLPFQAYKGDKPFLFVSYAHSDKLQVYPIIDYLHKSGFNVWYDQGISVSEDWIKSIVANIEKCTAFLVFITPHIIDSEYVRKEISYALKQKKPFYSVYLKDIKLPGELVFEISGIQSMKKYTMDDSEFYSKIKEVLSPVLSGKN